MLYISYWWLLTGLCLFGIYFILGALFIFIVNFINIISKNKFNKNYDEQIEKYSNNLNNISKVTNKIFIGITVFTLIVIPLNNIIYNVRQTNQKEQLNIISNERYISDNKYNHFYKVVAINNDKLDNCCKIYKFYYISSTESIEKIQEHKFIKVNKTLYIKPVVILEIAKEQYLENTKDILLEKLNE